MYNLHNVLALQPGASPQEKSLRAVAVVPMTHEGTVIGCLNVASTNADSFPLHTRIGIELVAAQAAGAIARIRAENERQRLEAQILEISDRQQALLGQEIHDGLCQQLVSLAFDANALHYELKRNGRPESAVATRIAKYLDDAITEARQLSRGLFPIRLEDEGLLSALQELAQSTSQRSGIDCLFECAQPALRADSAVATHIFRIAQEAITNAVKHGRARRISVQLQATLAEIRLTVEDDGIGLSAPNTERGMGLHIMQYRARNLGGQFQLGPGARGGTRVSCCVPCRYREKIGL